MFTTSLKTLLTLSILTLLTATLCARTWTNQEGQSFDGTMYKQDATHVWVRSDADARIYKIEKATLSEDDQTFLTGEGEAEEQSVEVYWETDLDKVVKRLDDDYEEPETCMVIYRYKASEEVWRHFMKEAIMKESTREKIGNRIDVVILNERNEDIDRRNETSFISMGNGPFFILLDRQYNTWSTTNIGLLRSPFRLEGEEENSQALWENHEYVLAAIEETITRHENLLKGNQ